MDEERDDELGGEEVNEAELSKNNMHIDRRDDDDLEDAEEAGDDDEEDEDEESEDEY